MRKSIRDRGMTRKQCVRDTHLDTIRVCIKQRVFKEELDKAGDSIWDVVGVQVGVNVWEILWDYSAILCYKMQWPYGTTI